MTTDQKQQAPTLPPNADPVSFSLGCPWCGSNDLVWEFADFSEAEAWHYVECKQCGAQGPYSILNTDNEDHKAPSDECENSRTNAWLLWQIRDVSTVIWPWSVCKDHPESSVTGASACPFCASTDLSIQQITGSLIGCGHCGANGPESSREWTDEQHEKYDRTPLEDRSDDPKEGAAALRLWNARGAPHYATKLVRDAGDLEEREGL